MSMIMSRFDNEDRFVESVETPRGLKKHNDMFSNSNRQDTNKRGTNGSAFKDMLDAEMKIL